MILMGKGRAVLPGYVAACGTRCFASESHSELPNSTATIWQSSRQNVGLRDAFPGTLDNRVTQPVLNALLQRGGVMEDLAPRSSWHSIGQTRPTFGQRAGEGG